MASTPSDDFVRSARKGNIDKVHQMLVEGMDVNAFSPTFKCTALMAACFENQQECVQLLLRNAAVRDVSDDQGYTAVHWACSSWHDNPRILELLTELGHGALLNMVTAHGNTPLHRAAAKGCVKQVSFILRCSGVDISARNADGLTPKEVAAAAAHPKIASKIEEMEVKICKSSTFAHFYHFRRRRTSGRRVKERTARSAAGGRCPAHL